MDGRPPLTAVVQSPLFSTLTSPAAAYLAARAHAASYRTGDTIIKRDQQGDTLFVIAHGWVQVLISSAGASIEGEVVLAEYGPGDVIGEQALLPVRHGLGSALALEPVSCFTLARSDVLAAIELYPSVARAFLTLLSARLHEAHQRIAREIRDPLTDLPDRGVLGEFYPRLVARLRRLGGELALVLLDVDRLKVVNDTHGHAAGDAVLRAVAHALQESIRGTDLAVRYGGDEFVLLLPGATTEGAHQVMLRVLFNLRAGEGLAGQISVSFGVAAVHQESGADAPSLDALLVEADHNLYRHKARYSHASTNSSTP